jgi:hypothetical protein
MATPAIPVYAATTYYVAAGSNGNGSSSSPFGTIQQCATTATSGDTCVIRSGTYRETVTPNSGVTFRPDTNAAVTVSGANAVSNWTQHSGNIYRATVTLTARPVSSTRSNENQVFVGSQMMLQARWPNTPADDARLLSPTWATAGAGSSRGVINDSSLPAINWTGATIRVFGGDNPFASQTGAVTGSSTGQIQFSTPNWTLCPSLCSTPGAKYYLLGKLAALDTAGEWFYDSATTTLYLWAPTGGTPQNVSVKQRDYAFDLRGKSNVTVRGLGLFANAIVTDDNSNNNQIDGIQAKYLSHFDYFQGYILDTEDTGIVLKGTQNAIRNSTLTYSAGGGVMLGGSNNTVSNNLIHNVGYAGNYATAINIPLRNNPGGHKIDRNTIYNTGRDGISISWNGTSGLTLSNIDISYNRIYNYSLTASDSGGVYACCQAVGTNTNVHHNWIYQSKNPTAYPALPSAGIYIDNGTDGFDMFQNVMWDNKGLGILLNIAGESSANHDIYNNTAFRSQALNGRAGQARGVAVLGGTSASGTVIQNNKVPNLIPAAYQSQPIAGLTLSNNTPSAAGATEGITANVGCNLANCGGESPPSEPVPVFNAQQRIEAESYLDGADLQLLFDRFGTPAPSNDIIGRYPKVDFGSGVSQFQYNVGVASPYDGGRVEVRIDSPTGTVLGTLTIANTGSFDTQTTQTISVQSATGIHDLYLIHKGSNSGGKAAAGNVDWFKFASGSGGGTTYRNATSRIEAESENAQQGVTDYGTSIGNIDAGDWLRYDLDFGSGVSSFTANIGVPAAYAGKQIQVRLDSTTGTIVGTLTVQSTGDWGTYQQQSVNLSQTPTGQRSVFLTFSGGSGVGNLDWITFGGSGSTTPLASVEAEAFSSSSGISNNGTGIGSLDSGDWAAYNGVNLGAGASRIEFRVAVDPCCAGKRIEVRQGSTSGTLLGTLTVQNTGGWGTYTTQSTTLSGASGTQNLYLVFQGGSGVGNLDWFKIY